MTLGPEPEILANNILANDILANNILANNDMQDGVYATPAIVVDTIYLQAHSVLFAFGEK